jgi:PmbA protein
MNEVTGGDLPGLQALEALVHLALEEAARLGVDQAEAAASHDTGLSATVRLGEVYCDSRKGSASTSETTPEAIREIVAKANSFAKLTAADVHSGLADTELMCTEILDLDLDHRWDIDASSAIALALECEAVALSYDKRINNSEGATVSSNRGVRAYGNSHGFVGSYRKSSHDITCVILAGKDGDMQRDYYYSSARDPAELEDVRAIGETAARRTVGRLGARKLKTRRVPVVYTPEIARGFIGHAIGAIAGSAQYRRASFLLDAVGEKIFPDFVSVQERPHLPKAMASASYDAEGVATWDRDIFSDGVLQDYVLSSYSARRLGRKTTANAGGTQNLIIPGNAADLDALLAQMGTGLLVEELIGQGVNGVTGDYSRGAVGHWVENGEIQYPVNEVTIAGNLRDLYKRIELLGNDQDLRGGIRCGSLLVGEMTVAGA